MALTSKQINHLNNMNRASDDVNLGTRLNVTPSAGSGVVNATDISGSVVTIASGNDAIKGYMVQVSRSGSILAGLKVINTAGSLLLRSGSGYALTLNDTYNYITY